MLAKLISIIKLPMVAHLKFLTFSNGPLLGPHASPSPTSTVNSVQTALGSSAYAVKCLSDSGLIGRSRKVSRMAAGWQNSPPQQETLIGC